jgi:general secretion pathway protein D
MKGSFLEKIMSIGNTTLVRRSVRSLLTVAGLAGGLFVAPAGANAQIVVAADPATSGAKADGSVQGGEQLAKAVELLAAGKVVAAKSLLETLSRPENAQSLSDGQRKQMYTALANASRRIKGMNPVEVSLQTAQDSLSKGDLVTVAHHAKAVVESPNATNSQTKTARELLEQADAMKVAMQPSLGGMLDRVNADFEAGNIAAAKSTLQQVTRAGLTLTEDQQHLVDTLQTRIVDLDAAPGMMQPGVIKPREEAAPESTAPVAAQPAATPEAAPAAQPPAADPIEQARKWEAQSLLAEADQAFEQARMKDAAEKYQRVLGGFGDQLTAEQKTHAENRLAESKVRMGVNVGDEGHVIDNVIGQMDLKRSQALAEFNNNVEQAGKALASGDPLTAKNLAAAARVNVNSVKEVFSASDLEAYNKQIDDLETAIDKKAEEIRVADGVTRAGAIQAASQQAQAKAASDKSRKINEAIDRVRALQKEMKYDEALQVCEQILFLDPNNATGLVLRDVISDSKIYRESLSLEQAKNRNIAIQRVDNSEAIVPPVNIMDYPSDWPGISHRRGEPMGMAETEDNRSALALLEKKRIPVNFVDTPFSSVVSFLNAVTQLNFDVDWEKLSEAGIDREAQISLNLTNVPVRTVLERVLEKASKDAGNGAWYAINDGVVMISTREDINKKKTLQIYDIRDLLIEVPDYANAPEFDLQSVLQSTGQGGGGGGGQSPFRDNGDQGPANRRTLEDRTNELINIITTNVDEQGWQENGGDVGFIQQLQGSLIITNTPANHRSIHGLLSKLREIRAMQINVETRFLLVRTDYFEQIGFDLDVYFNGQNNQVRAARAALPNSSVQPSDFFNFAQGGLQRRVFGAPTDANGDGTADPQVGVATALPSPLSVVGAGQNSLGLVESGVSGNFAQGILSRAPALGVGGQFLDDIQVDFLIKATQADRRTVTLTAPRLTFTNGQTSNIYVATQVAFVSDLTPVVSESAVGFDPTLATVNEGVRLLIEGTISADRRYVTMNVDASVAKIEGFQNTAVTALAGGGLINSASTQSFIQRPTTTVTRVQTTVTVPDQGTILLGGQRLVTEQEVESGVPVLSKIPIINRFFSNRIEVREEQTLLILIKPTILIQAEEENRHFPGLDEAVKFGG